MASVKKRGKKWYVSFKNERGLWQTRVTDAHDKTSAEKIARQWETDAAMRRSGVINSVSEAAESQAKRTIESHLADFQAKMKAARRSEDHISRTLKFIREICKHSGFQILGDIRADGVAQYTVSLIDADKSPRTVESRLTAIKSFTKWLTEGGKLLRDPLAGIKKPSPRNDRRHEHRMLLPKKWPWLEYVLQDGPDRHSMTGKERCLLYETAIQTGLRSKELRNLTRGHLLLDADRPAIAVKARSTKNKTAAKQYIRADLADRLRSLIANKTTKVPVFNLPHETSIAKMLRADLADARKAWLKDVDDPDQRAQREQSDFLAPVNDAGELLDFHSLRHTCGAWLAISGTTLNIVQQVMRHSTITLTIDTYGHLLPGATADAIDQLSSIQEPSIQLATGTDATRSCPTFVQNDARNGACSVPDDARPVGENSPTGDDANHCDDTTKGVTIPLDATCDESRPGGIRTPDQGIMSPTENGSNPEENSNAPSACSAFVENGVRDNAKTVSNETSIDSDLAVIIERWPDLPVAIKAGIVAMVRAQDSVMSPKSS